MNYLAALFFGMFVFGSISGLWGGALISLATMGMVLWAMHKWSHEDIKVKMDAGICPLCGINSNPTPVLYETETTYLGVTGKVPLHCLKCPSCLLEFSGELELRQDQKALSDFRRQISESESKIYTKNLD